MGILRKYGAGLRLIGRTLLVELFGKRLKTDASAPTAGQALVFNASHDTWEPGTVSSLPSGTNGGVLAYAADSWASIGAGTARQVLRSGGAGAPAWGQSVLPLAIGATINSADLSSSTGIGLQWAHRAIQLRDFLDLSWLSVWSVDGGSNWVYGCNNTTWCSSSQLLGPAHGGAGAAISLVVGTTAYLTVSGAGNVSIGDSSKRQTYAGGANVQTRTVSSNTTLDAGDYIVFVDTTGGAVTLTLPACATGIPLIIQRIAGANSVTATRAGGDSVRTGGASGNSVTWNDDTRHALLGSSTTWVAEA